MDAVREDMQEVGFTDQDAEKSEMETNDPLWRTLNAGAERRNFSIDYYCL